MQIAELQVPTEENTAEAAISFHALSGNSNPTTLRFMALIGSHSLHTLVDGGSTHNFIQSKVAKHLGLGIEAVPPISVVVGNGEKLECEGCIKRVPLSIQNCPFVADLFVVPIQGAELVLGVSWMLTVNPVLHDYERKELTIQYQGQPKTLQALSSLKSQEVQYHQLRRIVHSEEWITCFSLSLEQQGTGGV